MHSVIQDVRVAVRSLYRRKSFSVVVLLTLGLAIGANTAIFTLVNALLLKPLPVRDPGELVTVGRGASCCMNTGSQRNFELWAYQQYLDVLDRSQDYFTGLAAVSAQAFSVQARDERAKGAARTIRARLVSADYFSVIGAEPRLGRGFTAEENGGEHAVVVISDAYWRTHFNAAAEAVGNALVINGTPFTIVGVAPRGFFGETLEADPPDVWAPLPMQTQITQGRDVVHRPDVFWLYVFGRLNPGKSKEQAESWLQPQISQYMQANIQDISENGRRSIAQVKVTVQTGETGFSQVRRVFRDPLIMLMSMVALLLVICCSNIANLLLSHATAREKEIATRVALGARRGRLVRQLLTESVTLGLLGGALGLFAGYAATRAIVAMRFGNSYVPLALLPDLRVFAFNFAVAIATALLFGMVPALRASRMDIMARIRGVTDSPGARRVNMGKVLVVAQVAVSLALVAAAALLSRSLAQLQQQEFGFDANVVDANIDTTKAGYKYEQLETLYRTFHDRLAAIPGVQSVSYAQYAPFSGNNWSSSITIPGRQTADVNHVSRWTRVGPDFFQTVGIQLSRGRGIEERDNATSPHVVVVTESFANRFFPGEDAVGKHFSFEEDGSDPVEIVGVVQDVKYLSAREEIQPTSYLPLFQAPVSNKSIAMYRESAFVHDVLVRAQGEPRAIQRDIEKTLLAINPDLPIRSVRTMRQSVDRTMVQDIVVKKLSTSFGVLGLMVASIGMYGLMMYSVVRRTKELGIRFAIGATRSNVVAMVLGESLVLVGIGVAVGVPLAMASSRLAATLLYGVKPYDPMVLSFAAAVLLLVALVAACIPALRASRVDPLVVLRAE